MTDDKNPKNTTTDKTFSSDQPSSESQHFFSETDQASNQTPTPPVPPTPLSPSQETTSTSSLPTDSIVPTGTQTNQQDDGGNEELKAVVTSPHTPKKYGGTKVIATIFGIILLVGAVASGVYLVQREQELREQAKEKEHKIEICHVPPGNPENAQEIEVDKNAWKQGHDPHNAHSLDFVMCRENEDDDGDGRKNKDDDDDDNDGRKDNEDDDDDNDGKKDQDDDDDNDSVYQNCQRQCPPVTPTPTVTTTPTPTGSVSPVSCPSGTQYLFANVGQQLRQGGSVALEGTIASQTGTCTVITRNGVKLAQYCKKITVNFPNPVNLDTALIFDNDPKQGEQPWSINGVSLTVTGGGRWASQKLDITASQMIFDNGGDSSNFNVCVKTPSTTNTPTPTLPDEISAQCNNVIAYDTQWNTLSASDLSSLKQGDLVRFAVSGTTSQGSFDKARFTINGTQRPDVTTKKPGSEEFYDEYTIPSGTTSFTINAQVHHSTLGWF